MLRILPILGLVLLAGCNGSEDFSDAELGGAILQPSPFGDPLNPEVNANEVVFISGGQKGSLSDTTGIVNNLGYACGNVAAYIPGPDDSNGQGQIGDVAFEDLPRNLARCPTDARYVDFFIGQAAGGTGDTRVMLGRYWFPVNSNQGRYQVAPTDLIQSPARFEVVSDSEQLFMAAFLQSLDSDFEGGTPKEISIPPEAHEMVQNCCFDSSDVPPPEARFGQADYASFASDWDPWFDELSSREDLSTSYSLPTAANSVQDRLNASLDRARAGTYNAQALGSAQDLILAQLDRAGTQPLAFQLPVQVYPDGDMEGAGVLFETDQSEPLLSMIGIRQGASLDRQGFLNGVEADSLPDQDTADLTLDTGRILGNVAYYDESGDRVASDYVADYPDTDYTPSTDEGHVLLQSERARYTASGDGRFVTDGLYWMVRSGQVAINVDRDVYHAPLDSENGGFYRIALRRACTEADSSNAECSDPDNEIPGDERGENYPETLPSDDADGSFTVTHEIPKPGAGPNTTTAFHIQVLSNGDVVTDRDQDCADVDMNLQDTGGTGNGDIQEYRVGFVTRTFEENGNPESFNIALFMAGDPTSSAYDDIPQFTSQIQGRIKVSGADYGFYRLGDDNYAQGIRAAWTDLYGPLKAQASAGSGAADQQLVTVLGGGAAEGSLATCP